MERFLTSHEARDGDGRKVLVLRHTSIQLGDEGLEVFGGAADHDLDAGAVAAEEPQVLDVNHLVPSLSIEDKDIYILAFSCHSVNVFV